MPDIDQLSISISSSAKNVAQEIEALTQSLGKLKSRIEGTEQSAKNLEKTTKKAAQSSNSGAKKGGPLDGNKTVDSHNETQRIRKTRRELEALGQTSSKVSREVERVGSSGSKAGRTVAHRFSLASKAGHALSGAASVAAKAVGRLASVGGKLGGFAKTAAGGIASIVKQGTFLPVMFGKNLVAGVGAGIKSVTGLLGQFKRVVMYRAIRTVIKEITQGFKEGLKNLYAWSRGVGGEFAASMNRIATATQYLRNSLGALASPLIESLAPAIDYVIDKFVALINIVNQFLARLGGKSTYIAAKKAAAQWDTAASHAGGAAKAMKRYTLAFDELNILGKNSSGGGGGGGGSGTDASGMFETRPIEGEISSFADDIMTAFNTQNWARIGELLAGKFNDIIDSIPWSSIGDKIANGVNMALGVAHSFLVETDFEGLGKDISDLFNHAVSNIDWDLMGRTAGEKFGAVLRTLTSLWEGIDFSVLGQRLSEAFNGYVDTVTTRISEIDWQWLGQKFSYGLNNLFGTANWDKFGGMLVEGFNSTISVLRSAVSTFKWGETATAFATAINGIIGKVDWYGLGKTMQNLLGAAITMLKNTVVTVDWGTLGTKLATSIKGFFSGPDSKQMWADIGDTFNAALNGALDFGINFVENFSVTDFAESVKTALGRVDWGGIARKVWDLFATAAIKLGNLITVMFGGEIDQPTVNQVSAQIKDELGKGNTARNQTELDKLTGSGSRGTSLVDVLGVGTDMLTTVYDAIVGAYGQLPWKQWGIDVRNWIKENILEADWDTIIPTIFDKIGSGFQTMLLGLVDFLTGLFPGLEKFLTPVKKALTYNTDPNVRSEALAGVRQELGWRSYGMTDAQLQDLLDRSQPGVSPAVMDKDERERALAARDELANISNASRSDASIFTNIGSSFSNALSRGWNNIRQGAEQERYQRNVAKYTLLGGYYDVKEIGENIGDKIVNGPLGQLFSGASEQAKTEKALLNQAQFLVASGKSVKEISKELGLNTKQQKKLTDAMGISPAAAAAGYDNLSYQDVVKRVWAKNLGKDGSNLFLSWEQAEAVVDVIFQPEGNLQTKYQNQGMMDWLKKIFEPGVDTKTRVELIKNGWKTLPEFVGTNKVLSAVVELVKKITGQTPATLFGAALSVLSWLTKKNNGETPGTVFGAVLSVLSWMTKKNVNESPATVFGTVLSVFSSLSKASGSKDVKDLYGTKLPVEVELKKKANNKLTYNLKPGDNNIMYLMKHGGSFYGGSWHGIPAYAGGTLNAGSMFLAGEAGPEIVGHIGGRTEVLNKSQLASTMFTSVRAAMNPAVETFRAIGNSFAVAADEAMAAAVYAADALYTTATGYSGGYTASGDQSKDMDALLTLVRQGSEATRQQNELLRQQNELLRQINDKDFGGEGVSTAMLSKAFQRMNLRAGGTVIPVGTI